MQIQFNLRTAFIVLTAVAILSDLFRWATSGQSPFFTALTYFGLGGIGGVAACIFVAMLGITSAREVINQQRAFIFAGFCGLMVWIFIITLGAKMPLLFVLSIAACVVMFIAVRTELAAVESPGDPEVTLDRLKATKSDVRAELDDRNKRKL